MNRLIAFSGLLGALMFTLGCGPSQRDLREKTLSTLNIAADTWDGGADFKTDASDAWGNDVTAKVTKGVLNNELELRSRGPDGLPKNTDDVVVRRHKRHGESSVNQELERGSESAGRGAARGIVQGVKEGMAGKKKG